MEDENLIPLSYISQYNYCKRRVGLLMLEQQWNESIDTAKGRSEHEKVHKSSILHKAESVIITDLQVVSKKLGLIGKCDVIEAEKSESGTQFRFIDNDKYNLYPIEYKHGKLRDEMEYELQLCAQAMCIEEEYGCRIDKGAVFYISSHRRLEVNFDSGRRQQVIKTAEKLAKMLLSGTVPRAEFSAKCEKCSLRDTCLPYASLSAQKYMEKIYTSFKNEVEL